MTVVLECGHTLETPILAYAMNCVNDWGWYCPQCQDGPMRERQGESS